MIWLLLLSALFGAPQADEHTVLMLHLDEGAGELCRDVSAQDIRARLDVEPRRPVWEEGRFGKCLRFDGENGDLDGDGKGDADGLVVDGNGRLAQTGLVTVEMWVRPDRVEGRQTLCALNSLNGRYTLFMDGAALEFWMAFADAERKAVYKNVRSAPAIEAAVWQHVALSYDEQAMRGFINGVEVAKLEVPLPRFKSEAVSVTTIGRDGDLRPLPTAIRGYKGLIDEVRISSVARTEFEVPEELTAHTRALVERLVQTDKLAVPYADPPLPPVRERDVVVTGAVTLDGKPAPGVQVSDGEKLVATDALGRYRLALRVRENRHITLTRPSGARPTGPWTVLIDPAAAETEYTVDFTLASDPASARRRFNFLHTSDSQFTTPPEMEMTKEEYAQITSMTGDPAFLVCPGDLTMNGTCYELDMYREIARMAKVDLYNVFGGHDGNYGAPNYSIGNFERKIGPPHCSWDYGGVHFMGWVTEMHYLSEEAKARQAQWIENDLAAQPKGTPIFIVTHIPPERELLAGWQDKGYNIIGMLYGHWHSITQNSFRGIPALNCSPIRGADWGRFTRAFRVNTIEDGKLTGSEVRPTGQYQRLEVMSPSREGGIAAPLRVLAFDSASRVKSVTATIGTLGAAQGPVAEVQLSQLGQWTWGAEAPAVKPAAEGYQISVRAVDELGREWTAVHEVTGGGTAADVKTGADWPTMLGGEGSARTAAEALKPPLRVAWVANTGGRNQLLVSPIVWQGRVYVGVQTHDVGWRGAGMACYEAATGQRLWFTPLDSSVRCAPAVIGEVLVTVTHQGVVYGLDPHTGKKLWGYDLYPDPPIYRSVNKPVMPHDGKALVARDSATAVLLDPATGKLLREYGGQTGIYSAFPTAGDGAILFSSLKVLEAFDALSGQRLWRATTQTSRAVSPPVQRDGRIWVNAAQLHCHNAADGELLWKRPMAISGNVAAAPVFWGDLVIANGNSLRAFNRTTGEPAWEFVYPDPPSEQVRRQNLTGMSAPVVAGDVLYVGADNGRLHALEAATGKELWSISLGLPVKSWPAVSGNALFICDYDGNLWAFTGSPR